MLMLANGQLVRFRTDVRKRFEHFAQHVLGNSVI